MDAAKLFWTDHTARYDYTRHVGTEHVPLGIRQLCIAVLEHAIADLRGVTVNTEKLTDVDLYRAEAIRWFWSSRATEPFDFVSICAVLGLDAQAVRAAVLRNAGRGAAVERGEDETGQGDTAQGAARRKPLAACGDGVGL